ncbi:MAG: FliA/WhiG family RNA polymerase sigma factor [Acidobacteriota bacterium]
MSKIGLINSYNTFYTSTANAERDTLIEAHLPQIKYIAERIAARIPFAIDLGDLVGAGILGLLDAVDRFDPTRGVLFKTYAEARIRGAILDSLREMDWVPRALRRRAREVSAAYAQLEQQYGRPASEEEVAAALNLPLSEFHLLLGELRGLTVTTLDSEDEKDGVSLAKQIQDDLAYIPSALYERNEMRERLIGAVERLPERERQVIALYYVEELTMKEIGSVLNITESRVSQLHTKAILRLRTALTPDQVNAANN